jgi:hypothetical protein
MPTGQLNEQQKRFLLRIARQALQTAVNGDVLAPIDRSSMDDILLQYGASFVTLTRRGALRGCIGALEAYQPLVDDVREHVVAAALQDYRFPPVDSNELHEIQIEVSCLTQPEELTYHNNEELLKTLRPGIDGVILQEGTRRATFLPQVWEKLPDPEDFLSNLCIKMGASPDLWLRKKLRIWTYRVDEFHE